MRNRIISLLLVVALLPMCLAVPAMAEDTLDDNYFDVLDYTTPNEMGEANIALSNENSHAKFWLPERLGICYIDVVVVSTGDIAGVSVFNGHDTVELNVMEIADNVYRLYGDLNRQWAYYLTLYFEFVSDDVAYVTFHSFHASTNYFTSQSAHVTGVGVAYAQTNKIINLDYPDGVVRVTWDYASSEDFYYMDLNGQFHMIFQVKDWKKYDYLEMALTFICDDIASVACSFGSEVLDFTVNEIHNETWSTRYQVLLTIDLRGLDRTSDDIVNIEVTGNGDIEMSNSIYIHSAIGKIISHQPGEWQVWFTNLQNWLSSGFDSVTSSIGSWGQSIVNSIDALPDKIAEAIKDVFVPQDGAVEDMVTDSEDLIADRFGGVFEGAQIVDNWASKLQAQAATQILTVPVVEMNILGKPFPIGGWEVDLIPNGFEVIFESVKLLIDILATVAFVNGIKSRFERTLEK